MRPTAMLPRAFSQQRLKTTPLIDPYFGHKSISIALARHITKSPAFRRRRPTASEPFSNTPLDLYIARVIHDCGVPNIVPYTTLYLLVAVSRTCNCGRRPTGPEYEVSYNDDCDGSSKPPSTLSHRLSQFLTNNPFKRLRRPLWTAHHFFIGALLIVLREYQKGYSPSALAEISGVEVDDLIDLHIAISFCVNRDTASALAWMIKESEFRSLNDVECPVVVSRRKRLAERQEDQDNEHHSPLGRVFSIRRSRRKSSSSDTSLESQRSTMSWLSSSKSSWSP